MHCVFLVSGSPRDRRGADEEVLVILHGYTRLVEARPPPTNVMVVMMMQSVSENAHLPCARAFRKMNGKDTLYNDFRDYLKQQGVGFPHDQASRLGDDFLSNLSAIIFPLSNNVWRALNDKHNRGGVAPEQEFAAFFGRRVYSKKVDRPNYGLVLQHLQELWIGTNAVVKKGNWPAVACKLKHLLLLIEKYCKRVLGQGERQAILNQREDPARTAENASNVATIEALPGSKVTHEDLRSICNDLIVKDLYSLLDANIYMEGMNKWKR